MGGSRSSDLYCPSLLLSQNNWGTCLLGGSYLVRTEGRPLPVKFSWTPSELRPTQRGQYADSRGASRRTRPSGQGPAGPFPALNGHTLGTYVNAPTFRSDGRLHGRTPRVASAISPLPPVDLREDPAVAAAGNGGRPSPLPGTAASPNWPDGVTCPRPWRLALNQPTLIPRGRLVAVLDVLDPGFAGGQLLVGRR